MGTVSAGAIRGIDTVPGEPRESGPTWPAACRYHTVQPAPTQWVAIGVTSVTGDDGTPRSRLLVEVGRSEDEALAALRRRCG